LHEFFQPLTFLDDRFELRGDLLIVGAFDSGLFLLDFSQDLITVGLDLCNLGVDLCGLFALGDRDFILQTFESLLAGFFIYIGD